MVSTPIISILPQAVKDSLRELFKIENADPAKQAEFLASFEELAKEIALNCILDELNDADARIFLKLSEEDKTGDKALEFAKSKIPDLETKISQKIGEEINLLNY